MGPPEVGVTRNLPAGRDELTGSRCLGLETVSSSSTYMGAAVYWNRSLYLLATGIFI